MISRADVRWKVFAVVITFVAALALSVSITFLLRALLGTRPEFEGADFVPFTIASPLLCAGITGIIVAFTYMLRANVLLGDDPHLRRHLHAVVLRRRGQLSEVDLPVASRWASVLVPYLGFEIVSTVILNAGIVLSTAYLVGAEGPIGTMMTVILVLLVVVTIALVVVHGVGFVRARAFAEEHRDLLLPEARDIRRPR